MKKHKVSKEKKVWIFKWLVEKHKCSVRLVKSFFMKRKKKIASYRIDLDSQGFKTYTLMVDTLPDPKSQRKVLVPVAIPYKYNISYADVLDGIMGAMKKNRSSCWMSDTWSNRHIEMFLDARTTLEELAVEFDLEGMSMLGRLGKEPKG